ncbi:hypothetical protein FACS1894127_7950 [Clostridia bacterium]|nr:hypothetical protein FACS1894127_7950 [Clostridia bacterium]
MEIALEKIDKIDINPQTLVKEIAQNCTMILATPKGTVPLDRGFGLDTRALDKPVQIARTFLVADITAAIEQYEPRAVIKDIKFSEDPLTGVLMPKVIIEVKDNE